MEHLPAGTVTFLFTDIAGSTDLVQRLGDRVYSDLIASHRALLRVIFSAHHGLEMDTQGDAFFVAFAQARDAVTAAVAIQAAVAAHARPSQARVRVRIGVHTGSPVLVGGAYVGVDVHRAARICAAGHGGQVLLSQATCALITGSLPDGMGLADLGEHRLRDLRRSERIFQVLHPHLPPDLPPLRSLSVLPHNLPVQLTSFIGRERETGEVKRLLAGARLLTLSGSGGSGKTRLAIQVGADLLEIYSDGVWLVDLAPLSNPALIPSAVAAALAVREQSGRPLAVTLTESLRAKRLLLILDNCEHLVDACAQMAESLLQAGPQVTILATSRERLNVPGETVYLVPPLSLPETHRPLAVEELIKTEAVRLFVERASSVHPGWSPAPAVAADIARIVQALDGIPLAIELAAARVTVLSTAQIAERLRDRFRLLTAGSRTALPRQQTLVATMDWSYELLSEPERALLRRLSVFAGGLTLEAAEVIGAGDGVDRADILDLLARLVDKSLVLVDDSGIAPRYRLLDTVREYAREKLAAAGEDVAVRDRHRVWYRGVIERAEPHLDAYDRAWMDLLEQEHDNIRAALEATVFAAHGEDALRSAVALQRLWHVRGHWTEGRRWLEAALAASPDASPALRAKAMGRTAMLVQLQGDYHRARVLAEEGLALYRALGDARGMAIILNVLGNITYNQGDFRTARELHEASLAHGREAGDQHSIASSLLNLAIVADHLGQYDQAVTWCRDSLVIFREIKDPRGIAFALSFLGTLASDQDDYAAARPLLEESLALQRQSGDKQGVANTLVGLGLVAREQGDLAAAHALLSESLSIRRELGNRHGMAAALTALAQVAVRRHNHSEASAQFAESLAIRRALGDKGGMAECLEGLAQMAPPAHATRLLAAAGAIRSALGSSRRSADQHDFEQLAARLLSTLGEEVFRAAWTDGEALTPEAAADEALRAQFT